MNSAPYLLDDSNDLETPALVYYVESIRQNIRRSIEIAGGPGRLWPHVKSHKTAQLIQLQQEAGIRRFKCATLAEGELAARCGAPHVLLAYPLVGPSISRFLRLAEQYPHTIFWAIGDDLEQLSLLGKAALRAGPPVRTLVDVNLGMNRTGVPVEELASFYRQCAALEGIRLRGLHLYDGHNTQSSLPERRAAVQACMEPVWEIVAALEGEGMDCSTLVLGGTPSFPVHASQPRGFLSPGTAFLFDYGYRTRLGDLDFTPAALLVTRVISRPAKGLFTLDLGSKAIATDPSGVRGLLLGVDNASPLFQSEEHWVFSMDPGHEAEAPPVGRLLYVMPTHVCPTSALYSHILVVEGGKVADCWPVAARDRKLSI